jgi:hypothetical protein
LDCTPEAKSIEVISLIAAAVFAPGNKTSLSTMLQILKGQHVTMPFNGGSFGCLEPSNTISFGNSLTIPHKPPWLLLICHLLVWAVEGAQQLFGLKQ